MVAVRTTINDESLALLKRMVDAPKRYDAELGRAMTRVLVGIENELKVNLLRGGDPNSPRNGELPLAVRSGALLGSVGHQLDRPPGSGVYGTTKGVTTAYAKTILGEGTTTILPRNAKHLWIPVGENRTRSGVMRMSPREAFEQLGDNGKPRLRIFRSKRGNLVAFLSDAKGGSYARGKNKGRQRGKLLFVLKDRVEVKGTGALVKAWVNREAASTGILAGVIRTLLEGGTR